MAKEVRLPLLGQTMEEGTIVGCSVSLGDEVKKGNIIFEIEIDKATLEMESPVDGFVKHILAEVGQTLLVGEPLLVLGEKDEEVGADFIESLKTRNQKPETRTQSPKRERGAKGKVIKKLAGELGVNLAAITGTGAGGKITEQDVRETAESKSIKSTAAPEVKLGATIPVSRLQKITAHKMLQSKREIPCFYLTVKADVTDVVELRTKLNKTSDVKISYNDFIIKAVAVGLGKFPVMTGQLAGDVIQLAEAIGIGLAISVPDGLVAPIVKNVDKKTIAQIARDSKVLIEKARSNKLAPADLEGGCITVSNLGASGIESFIPIVVPGQCSILGIGRIIDTCVPDNGEIVVRKLMNMTLSVNHRVTNGAYAAQFLDFVRKAIEDTSNFAR